MLITSTTSTRTSMHTSVIELYNPGNTEILILAIKYQQVHPDGELSSKRFHGRNKASLDRPCKQKPHNIARNNNRTCIQQHFPHLNSSPEGSNFPNQHQPKSIIRFPKPKIELTGSSWEGEGIGKEAS